MSLAAVLGLSSGENLFLEGEGWAKGSYCPAYVRRYPFCMAKVTLDKVEQQNRLICVESDYAEGEGGEALFDPQGQPIEKWKGFERLITEYEADLERVNELCAILGDYGLLEPFTMQATLNQGGAMQLTGMHRAAEPKLEALNAAQLKNLLKKVSEIPATAEGDTFGRIYEYFLGEFARAEGGCGGEFYTPISIARAAAASPGAPNPLPRARRPPAGSRAQRPRRKRSPQPPRRPPRPSTATGWG